MALRFATTVENNECLCGCGAVVHFMGVGKCQGNVNGMQCPCFRFRLADANSVKLAEQEREMNLKLIEWRQKRQQLDSMPVASYTFQ